MLKGPKREICVLVEDGNLCTRVMEKHGFDSLNVSNMEGSFVSCIYKVEGKRLSAASSIPLRRHDALFLTQNTRYIIGMSLGFLHDGNESGFLLFFTEFCLERGNGSLEYAGPTLLKSSKGLLQFLFARSVRSITSLPAGFVVLLRQTF
jgi:hypothetical protein